MNPKHPPTAGPERSETSASASADTDDGATKHGPPSSVQESVEVQERRWRSPSQTHDGVESQD